MISTDAIFMLFAEENKDLYYMLKKVLLEVQVSYSIGIKNPVKLKLGVGRSVKR